MITIGTAGPGGPALFVKISSEFEFDARLIDRKQLRKGTGKHARLRWGDAPATK